VTIVSIPWGGGPRRRGLPQFLLQEGPSSLYNLSRIITFDRFPTNTMSTTKWVIVAFALNLARAATTPTDTISGTPTITQITSIASPTAPLTATLPSQVPLPPAQAWCPSEIFCAGAVRHVTFSCFGSGGFNAHIRIFLPAPANRQHR
jgi:hypothetical protein